MQTCLFPLCLDIFGCYPNAEAIKPKMETVQVESSQNQVEDKNGLIGDWIVESNSCPVSLQIRQDGESLEYKLVGKLIQEKAELKLEENYIVLKNFSMLIDQNALILQNYGNAMNPFHHIKECDEKYIKFIKHAGKK